MAHSHLLSVLTAQLGPPISPLQGIARVLLHEELTPPSLWSPPWLPSALRGNPALRSLVSASLCPSLAALASATFQPVSTPGTVSAPLPLHMLFPVLGVPFPFHPLGKPLFTLSDPVQMSLFIPLLFIEWRQAVLKERMGKGLFSGKGQPHRDVLKTRGDG